MENWEYSSIKGCIEGKYLGSVFNSFRCESDTASGINCKRTKQTLNDMCDKKVIYYTIVEVIVLYNAEVLNNNVSINFVSTD